MVTARATRSLTRAHPRAVLAALVLFTLLLAAAAPLDSLQEYLLEHVRCVMGRRDALELDPPTVWLTRSMNVTALDLKPIVLMFARLFPITARYCPFALRPDSPAENEPTAITCSFQIDGSVSTARQ